MSDATRRQFIQNSSMALLGASAAGMLAGPAFGQAKNETDSQSDVGKGGPGFDSKQPPTLVTIYLRGGADSLSMLVPFGDPLYYQYRQSTAIPAKNQGGKRGVLEFHKSKYFGLNPNMEALLPLMLEGHCIPVLNTGSTHGTRSHFEAQDYMERAAPGVKSLRTGWLNRYLYATKKPFDRPLRGIAPQRLLPRALRGRYPVLAGFNKTEEMDTFEKMYADSNLVNKSARQGAGVVKGSLLDNLPKTGAAAKIEQQARTADMARDIIAESGTAAVTRIKALWGALSDTVNDVPYPSGHLADQLSVIARVIKANVGLEVAQADLGGWDHHSGQGGVDGRMGRMLKHVGDSMAAFYKDLGPRMNKVVVLVMTEFGRTVHENGNNGTDHGHGSIIFTMGGMLKPAPVYGQWTGLDNLNYGRFMPVTTDFRLIFAESLFKLFGFNAFEHEGFFPEYTPKGKPLDFMNRVTV